MALTPTQRRVLTWYRDHRTRPVTIRSILRPYLLFCVVLIVCAAASAMVLPRAVSGVIVGCATGMIYLLLLLAMKAKRNLPVVLEVFDWEKLDRLLEEDAAGAEQRGRASTLRG